MDSTRTVEWDLFLSHASEDKTTFVRPLATALRSRGYRVWYDEFTLTVGDRLRPSIERGLAKSRYGVVVLSPSFFEKQWPQDELDGLYYLERNGVKVLLPVYHNITHAKVAEHAPMLAGRLAVESQLGVDHVVEKLSLVLDASRSPHISFVPQNLVPKSDLSAIVPVLSQSNTIRRYYLGSRIPPRIRENAARRARVPATDAIWAVVDCSDSIFWWNSGKLAIVFAASGIYYVDNVESAYVSYQETAGHTFTSSESRISLGRPGQYARMYHIDMITGTFSYMSAFWLSQPDAITNLLNRIASSVK